MDLLEGESLADRIEGGDGMPWQVAVRWFGHLGAALSALHGLDVIRRDVKPSNVLLTRLPGGEETAVLIDFGLVKELRSASTMRAHWRSWDSAPG